MVNKLTKVESSMLYAVGYDEKEKVMEAVFLKGGIWRYWGVPKDVYEALIRSRSIGSYMRNEIIDCYDSEPI